MEITTKPIADITLIQVRGRIDHQTAVDFENALRPHLNQILEGEHKKILIDFEGLDFITSAGLRVLMIAAKACDRQKGIIALAGLQTKIQEIFKISRFDLVFTIFPTTESALKSLFPHTMRIRFWGTRGSIPTAPDGRLIRAKVKKALQTANGRRFDREEEIERFIDESLDFPTRFGYGGDSSCVQIEGTGEFMVCDMGSGLRRFGQQIMKDHGPNQPKVYHFFMSHLHWDHIMGFPFFAPAYIPGNTIHIYGGHDLPVLKEAFRRQQSAPCFPVDWDQLGARISFTHLDVNQWYEINGFRVKLILQGHRWDSYGYRFEKDGKTFVYSTDAEHKEKDEKETGAVVEFFRDADLVVFDAMYSLADMITIKEDWGHSSNIVGVDLCLRAKVKHYCMFHHEPIYSDETLYTILQETKRYGEIIREGRSLQISTAYDNWEIDV
jgi:anti-anti-sigma factor